jgi:PAS domain S-box-containing protein
MAHPIRVLIVAGRDADQGELSAALEREDDTFLVETADSKQAALDALETTRFDCLVAGNDLPVSSGIDLLRGVRQRWPHLPFVLFPADGSEDLASEAIDANVSAYLPNDDDAVLTTDLADTIHDLVDRPGPDEALLPLDQVYESIARTVSDVFWTYDLTEESVWFSDGITTFGYDPDDPSGDVAWFLDTLHPEDRESIQAQFEALADREVAAFDRLEETTGTFSHEFRFRRADGTYADCVARGLVRFHGDDRTTMIGAITDISERKENERALERTHERMEFALESIDATIWVWDADADTVTTHPDPHHVLGHEISDLDDFLETVHPVDRSRVREELAMARSTDTTYHVEYRLANTAGERWVEDYGERRETDDDSLTLVGVATDITERKARERQLEQNRERLSVALEVADAGVWEWDPETDEVVWHESTEQLFGLEPGTFEGTGDAFTDFVPDEQMAAFQEQLDKALPNREPFEGEYRVKRASGDDWWLHTRAEFVDIDGLTPRYIGVVTDVTELKQYEHTLTTLHEMTRELVRSDDSSEVSRHLVNAAQLLLQVRYAAVLLYDEDEVALMPEVVSPPESETDDHPVIHPQDEEGVWRAFVEGETITLDQASATLGEGGTIPYESAVMLPLGDHGLFVIGEDGPESFDERTISLAEILAANAEAALDRISREQELEHRDRKLRDRAARLEQLDEVNERVRGIIQQLIRASTRDEVEEIVCSELVTAERFELASISEYDPTGGTVTVRSYAGSNQDYYDAISFADDEGLEPTLEAARSRETVTIAGIGRDFSDERWRQQALVRGFQSVLAVPIGHDDIPYGVLTVYANSPETFNDETRGVLEELGTTIAHVLRTVVQREALQSDRQVELEFEVRSPSSTLFTLSNHLDASISIDRVLSQSDSHLAYGSVEGTGSETFRDVAESMLGIDQARVLSADGELLRVELRLTGETALTAPTEYGGTLQELVAEDGTGRLSMVFPANAKLNQFIDAFVDRYPDTELSARREREGAPESARQPIQAAVTDRQDEVIRAAYHSGFFDWPRESTGEDVAGMLDISPSAFRENLRRAERNLLEWYVEMGGQHTRDSP